MKNEILAFVVVALIVVLPATSSINATVEPIVEVNIQQYCKDGIKEFVKELSVGEAKELENELREMRLPINPTEIEIKLLIEEYLRILKGYNLIPLNITADQMKADALERSKDIRDDDQIVKKISSLSGRESEALFGVSLVALNAPGFTLGNGIGVAYALGTHSRFSFFGVDIIQYFAGVFSLKMAGFPCYVGIGLAGAVVGFTGFLIGIRCPTIYGPFIHVMGYHCFALWRGIFLFTCI
jgi:hypothetical protein